MQLITSISVSMRSALHLILVMLPLCASADDVADATNVKGVVVPVASSKGARDKVTVPIEKSVPSTVKTVLAPDGDRVHYRTLDGTHFSYRCHDPYTFPNKIAAVEVCEIDPVTLQILSWPETEVINLVYGEVTIAESNGRTSKYVAGDVFVLPQGFKGVWHQSEKLLKVVVRQPLYWKD